MANKPEEAGKSPKDITPNPMDEAAKKAEAAAAAGAEPAAPAVAATDTTPQEEPEDPGPQNVKDLLKESLMDSHFWNRFLQVILLMTGVYGLVISVMGQSFLPLPALIGSALLALVCLMDIYLVKKFRKTHDNFEITIRIVMAAILGLMTVFFILELFFNNFGKTGNQALPFNKTIIEFMAGILLLVFTFNFFFFIAKHKEMLLAEVFMFLAVIFGGIACFAFFNYYVIISFVISAVSMICMIASLGNYPLKNDDRLNDRIFGMAASIIMFLAIFAYAATIFFIKPLPVIVYGPVTDTYEQRPIHLGWSGDSWSFDYGIFNQDEKVGRIGIINALSLGVNELPPKDDKLKLPQFTDSAVWNRNGTSLVFTAGGEEKGSRSIWAVALNLSLVAQEIEKARLDKEQKEKAEKEARDKATLLGGITSEVKAEKERIMGREEKPEIKLRTEEDDRLNRPVGKAKVLLADMALIVDKDCMPITHRTAWSPDGRKFCFAARDKNSGNFNIWSADVKSQEIMRLTKGGSKIMPLWSPSGEKILYCTKTDTYSYLKISDYNGGNARELSVDRKQDRDLFPLWNKDESKVIYVKDNPRRFVVMNANATNQQDLNRKSFPVSPYWLTDSKKKVKLEFTESGVIWKVWTMNTSGEKVKNIFTEQCEGLAQPKWSYDGKTIALAANYGDKTSTVFRMNKDGKMLAKLFTTKAHVSEIEWANSSKRLAFLAKHEPAVDEKSGKKDWFADFLKRLGFGPADEKKFQELWIVENDGTEPRSIYDTEGELNNISWNDLGNWIAFDENIHRPYFANSITTVKVAETRGDDQLYSLLPYEFNAQYPTWSSDGQVLAYVSWNNYWTPGIAVIKFTVPFINKHIELGPGLGDRVWAAKLE